MTDEPRGAMPTLPAFEQMVREQKVTVVLQIDPYVPRGEALGLQMLTG